jgi:methyltransferase
VSILYAVIGLVVLQRVGELILAATNVTRLRGEGAIEADRGGYPWFIALHAGWLASIVAFVPANGVAHWPLLAVFAALQLARAWVIASLGRRWTTRVIVLPGAPLISTGPYRWLRHPNYAIVAAEIAILPLAFGAVGIAMLFSALNLALLARRIRIEDRALAANAAGRRRCAG